MTWRVWSLFLMTETVLSISPGPAVLFVISQSLAGGFWHGLWAAAGILSANVVWFTLSAVGVGAAILAAGEWFYAVKWLGAAYLIYLAIKPLVHRPGSRGELKPGDPPRTSARQLWSRGLVLQMANPKALVFFVALLPQFVAPDEPVGPQILILGLTSLAAEFPVLAVYAALAGRTSQLARGPGFNRAVDYVAAVLLVAAALGIAFAPAGQSAGNGAAPALSEKQP